MSNDKTQLTDHEIEIKKRLIDLENQAGIVAAFFGAQAFMTRS